MFEKTKLVMTIVFTLCFLAYSVLIGKFYDKFHISRTVWIILCIVLSVAVAVTFIMDLFSAKHDKDLDVHHE